MLHNFFVCGLLWQVLPHSTPPSTGVECYTSLLHTNSHKNSVNVKIALTLLSSAFNLFSLSKEACIIAEQLTIMKCHLPTKHKHHKSPTGLEDDLLYTWTCVLAITPPTVRINVKTLII
jgi:hypothetical protein